MTNTSLEKDAQNHRWGHEKGVRSIASDKSIRQVQLENVMAQAQLSPDLQAQPLPKKGTRTTTCRRQQYSKAWSLVEAPKDLAM